MLKCIYITQKRNEIPKIAVYSKHVFAVSDTYAGSD